MRAAEQALAYAHREIPPKATEVIRLEPREVEALDELVQREADTSREGVDRIRARLAREILAAGILAKRRERGLAP